MKAMILAAGRGKRMRPLSDHTPKPLLKVQGKALLQWHIEHLRAQGFCDIVINVAHLGEQIVDFCGDGSRFGVKIAISDERNSGALESAGGILNALALLGDAPFLVVNGDVWCDYRFDPSFNLGDDLAHLILVPNPPHHLQGDFALQNARLNNEGEPKYTFSGIGYYAMEFFKGLHVSKMALAPLLRHAATANRIGATLYEGVWLDIGTPERLQALNKSLQR